MQQLSPLIDLFTVIGTQVRPLRARMSGVEEFTSLSEEVQQRAVVNTVTKRLGVLKNSNLLKVAEFYNVEPCSLAEVGRRFRIASCLRRSRPVDG
jgi:hypothetical protein